MNKKLLILVILCVIWAILFITNFAKAAESPTIQITIPQEFINDPVKSYAFIEVTQAFGTSHWKSFYNIINKESSWDPKCKNPVSTAYGLAQFLDGTWKDTGFIRTSDPYTQIDASIIYIMDRYGTPNSAWEFHKVHNWY